MPKKYDLDKTGKKFSRRWFTTRNKSDFSANLPGEWADKPVKYLEIGCFEGMSLCWMHQHILTHPDSHSVGIDPWLMTRKLSSQKMEEVYQQAQANTEDYRCQLIRGSSDEVLGKMAGKEGFAGVKKKSLDICMIDGNHRQHAVLFDAQMVFRLMKSGGWIIFDDVRNSSRKSNHVIDGIRLWMEADNPSVELIWSGKYADCYKVTE